MKSYKFIFSVVVFRNSDDLEELIESIKLKVNESFRIIIVNNFYDTISEQKIKKIAMMNDCDFISSTNDGYGAGNNKVIEFAKKNYKFEYIIISNPDIIIKKLESSTIKDLDGIIAPYIQNKFGKKQNPMAVFNIPMLYKLIYIGLRKKNKTLFFLGVGLNKIIRESFLLYSTILKKSAYNIYMAHGSFLIIPYKYIERLKIVYDENIFLFAEELYLADRLKKEKIKTWYTEKVEVLHKEDGSMKFRNDINKFLIVSNLYVFEKYYFKIKEK